MAVWALADLHLALSIPEKSMESFGEPWINYTRKLMISGLNILKPMILY